jgi:lipopolysaccharide transport system ATP-binding protein
MKTAIKIEDVSKLYRLGTVGTGTMAHDLNRWWHQIRGKEDPYAKVGQVNDRTQSSTKDQGQKTKNGEAPDYVWALRGINLEVQQGEILGIIGRNGAGKSTLLKLLSRVTAPTTGSIKTKGRIASLLEVGTGFHPELTGRENIYINGAILGMKRHEITQRLDEIVEFSGCAKYLDTPVKRYSSGMMVRLGFAVAAHLNCEILIVDEVLAVGDADFQKKCLGKMRNMHTDGRSVLVVSHQMSMITAICDRGIVLQHGRIAFDGNVEDAVLTYQTSGNSNDIAVFDATVAAKPIGDDRARLRKAWAENAAGKLRRTFDIAEPIIINMEYEILRNDIPWPYANYHVFDSRGEYVFVTANCHYRITTESAVPGRYVAACEIPANLLNTGTFSVGIAVTSMDRGTNVCFWERDALTIQVVEDMDATLHKTRHGYAGLIPGPIRPELQWKISECSPTA